MDEFLKKWKEDPKYKTKIKLLLYILFVALVSVYALTANNNPSSQSDEIDQVLNGTSKEENKTNTNKDTIVVPNKYNYQIKITIDDKEYLYTGTKTEEQMTINKNQNDTLTKYILKDNKYYVLNNDTPILTTKEDVYDEINYNYIDIPNINLYLNNAKKDNNQYLVYLKDIILGNTSEEYFVITINDNRINIDYKPLIKQFNQDIIKYIVEIKIEEIE